MNTRTQLFVSILMLATGLSGCATQDPTEKKSTQDQAQAVRDFIEVRKLEEVSEMHTGSSDSWQEVDQYFLVYEGRRDKYLVEFSRRCYALDDNARIVADRRWEANRIRARFDTIRGCQIGKIFALTEAEAAELESIGEAPGSRN